MVAVLRKVSRKILYTSHHCRRVLLHLLMTSQVGFSGYFLTDDRSTAVSIAARVVPSVQGQRVMVRMADAKEAILRQTLKHSFNVRLWEVYNPKTQFADGGHIAPHYKAIAKKVL